MTFWNDDYIWFPMDRESYDELMRKKREDEPHLNVTLRRVLARDG